MYSFVFYVFIFVYRSDSLISSDARPAWMRTLHTTASNWLAMVPEVRMAIICNSSVY